MIVHDGDSILLVSEQGPDDPHPEWLVPNGSVEDGESPRAAAIRTTTEVTGILVTCVKERVWCNFVLRKSSTSSSVAFKIVAKNWVGPPAPNDRDLLAISARFVPLT